LHTPWHALLQKEIDAENYASSLLHQPNLHVRVRPGKKEKVLGILAANHLSGEWLHENTLVFPNATKLDDVFSINRDVVVQDAGSQQCGVIIKKILPHMRGKVWDACAASGGKSIQLIDLYGGLDELWVSDVRETILNNLSERFRQAGIHTYQSFVADLTKPLQGKHANLKFDVALVDAPCTGSGTWSRTPEQHYCFSPEQLATFSKRQSQICHTVIPHIKKGGYLIYITCSVFDAENNMVMENILQHHNLSLIHAEVIDGTKHLHDSMYVAIMQKN
jgi:16S rRNA (cytosine967-C5)-methyltransferase